MQQVEGSLSVDDSGVASSISFFLVSSLGSLSDPLCSSEVDIDESQASNVSLHRSGLIFFQEGETRLQTSDAKSFASTDTGARALSLE